MGSTFPVHTQGSLAREEIATKMMLYVFLISSLALVNTASATCDSKSTNPASAQDAANYRETCISVLSKQVEMEPSLQYLLMAAQFSQDTYNLPGVAKLFWEHADEEREHAKKFIEYLRLRGSQENDFLGGNPIKPILGKNTWDSVSEALRDALKMEKAVSGSMKQMIDLCSQGGEDDPHAADWLTSTWLEEQLNGQRHLAGLINSLESFSRDHNELGEWLFAKEI